MGGKKKYRLLKKESAGDGGEEEWGTTWKKRTSGGEREQDRAVACLLLLCGSSAGQPPASVQLQTSVSPAKKNKEKLGDQERQRPCLAVFGWQLASGTARLEGDLQLVESVRGTSSPSSLTVALDRQLQIPDATAQPALEQGQPRLLRQP